MNKYKDFEDFLRHQHIEKHPEIFDNDLPDHFDNWLAEIPQEMMMLYADKYGIQCALNAVTKLHEVNSKTFDELYQEHNQK